MTLTFTPPVAPSPGSEDKTTLKLLKADFGDGYSSNVPDGINYIRHELSLTWDVLTPTDAATITAFFEARKGCEPFYYTPSDQPTPLKWVCIDWTRRKIDGGLESIQAKFTQSFI